MEVKAGQMSRQAVKAKLLKELLYDGDWDGAAKRVGLSPTQLMRVRADEKFMDKAENIIGKQLAAAGGADEAVKKFLRTQEVLQQALESGELGVANSLMKSHDVELRMHGLFEKDNSQKRNPVMINIDLSGSVEGV